MKLGTQKKIKEKKFFSTDVTFHHKFETGELLRVSDRPDLKNMQRNDTLIGVHLNYEVLPPSQNVRRFGISRFIAFTMYLDRTYI